MRGAGRATLHASGFHLARVPEPVVLRPDLIGYLYVWPRYIFRLVYKLDYTSKNIIKIKIHFSCVIEDFVETHLCKLCVILRSRVSRVVCPN